MTIELHQDPEAVRTRVVWAVAIATTIVCAVLVAIAWWLVEPRTASPLPKAPSPLETSLFDDATTPATGDRAWIERAIDAVVADPSLIRHQVPR